MTSEFNFQWHITSLCNLRCKHCYQDTFNAKADLSLLKLQSVADNIFKTLMLWNKTTRINITGGEPLLKKELFPLLQYLDKSNRVKELTIITNATLIDKTWIDTFKAIPKLKNIKVSLDGAIPDINDSIRGEGVFQEVNRALRLLKEYADFKVILMFTLMKKNIKDIAQIFNFCKKEKLDGLVLERFIPQGQANKIKDEVLDKQEWKDVVELVLDFCVVAVDEKEILPYKAFWIVFKGKAPLKLYGATCNVADQSLCIMPDATVFPCRRFNLPIGNLLKTSLKDIWENTPLLKEVRSRTKLKGRCGACAIDKCFGCRALAYSLTGNYLQEDCQCWHNPKSSKISSSTQLSPTR